MEREGNRSTRIIALPANTFQHETETSVRENNHAGNGPAREEADQSVNKNDKNSQVDESQCETEKTRQGDDLLGEKRKGDCPTRDEEADLNGKNNANSQVDESKSEAGETRRGDDLFGGQHDDDDSARDRAGKNENNNTKNSQVDEGQGESGETRQGDDLLDGQHRDDGPARDETGSKLIVKGIRFPSNLLETPEFENTVRNVEIIRNTTGAS